MQVSTSFAVFKYQRNCTNKDSDGSQKINYQVELEKFALNGEVCYDVLKNQNSYNNKANIICILTPVKEVCDPARIISRGITKEKVKQGTKYDIEYAHNEITVVQPDYHFLKFKDILLIEIL
ncbi:hypothetical protein ABPG74_010096 [Tetrahymena malaccensis]